MEAFRTSVHFENALGRGELREVTDMLVDSNSLLTWVPRSMLEELGIRKEKELSFQTADGRILRRDVGFAIVRVGERDAPDDVVFAEAGDRIVLGARSLSGLNLRGDAPNSQLVDAGPIVAAVA